MLFSSEKFIFAFLPIFLLVYYIAPKKYRNAVLFLGSIIFYAIGEFKYLPLMLISLTLNYVSAIMIAKSKRLGVKRTMLIMTLFVDFSLLIGFKGFSNHIPLGISFYTFQIAAYVIDVYRRDVEAEKNYVSVGTYLCMFPQLIAGPIILYTDVSKEIKQREYSFDNIEEGLKTFVLGLASKLLIADVMALLWNEIQVTGYDGITTAMSWLGALAYAMEIYFDFNGYSLMAIGLGRMLGFNIPKNFDNPYISHSVSEFWRRWHITLGRWFKDYIYIPLGGNRKGTLATIRNLFIVWLLTGLWHGVGVNFVIWGLGTFVLIASEKLFLSKYLKKSKIFSRLYVTLFILVSWVVFAIEDLGKLKMYLLRMFPFITDNASPYINHSDYIGAIRRYGVFFVIAIVLCIPGVQKIYKKYKNSYLVLLGLLIIFWICVWKMETSASNPFLYFRF